MNENSPYSFQERSHIELRADTYTLPSPEMRKAIMMKSYLTKKVL